MKLRIVSDLHLDINRQYEVTLPYDDIFTLIAGDLGGDYKNNEKWLRENVKQGIFISGNHDAYTKTNTPIEDVKKFYHDKFPENGNIVYMDEFVDVLSKEIEKDTIIIADVLYTDYTYKCGNDKGTKKEIVERNMWRAIPKMSGSYMNDFTFLTRKINDDNFWCNNPNGLYYIRPQNYLDHFNRTFKKINEIVENNNDKNIILMSHHCLSPKFLSNKYVDSQLNASYVSNKEAWIKKHPNIKLVISGHVHNRSEFKIGKTLCISNPLGYLKRCENIQYDKFGKKKLSYTPNLIVDTKDWSVSREEYSNEKWEKLQQEYNEKIRKLNSLFF